jgi:probable rRNA maturation factor
MTDWHIDVGTEKGSIPGELLEELVSAVRWTLSHERAGSVELSLALMTDETISGLNEQYLSHDGPTDVISFPLEQVGDTRIGDIYIGIEQAERQAEELGVPLREELLRLAIHGALHVLGWEHPEDEGRETSPMFRRQEELLRSFLERP